MIIATLEYLLTSPLVLAFLVAWSITICLKQIEAQNKKPQFTIKENLFLYWLTNKHYDRKRKR